MKIEKNYDISTQDVIDSIKSIDEKILIAREAFQDAPINKKNKWEKSIDKLLDDRLSLMQLKNEYCS